MDFNKSGVLDACEICSAPIPHLLSSSHAASVHGGLILLLAGEVVVASSARTSTSRHVFIASTTCMSTKARALEVHA